MEVDKTDGKGLQYQANNDTCQIAQDKTKQGVKVHAEAKLAHHGRKRCTKESHVYMFGKPFLFQAAI